MMNLAARWGQLNEDQCGNWLANPTNPSAKEQYKLLICGCCLILHWYFYFGEFEFIFVLILWMQLDKDKDYFFLSKVVNISFQEKAITIKLSLLYRFCSTYLQNYILCCIFSVWIMTARGLKCFHRPLSSQSVETLCGLALTVQLVSLTSCGSWILRWAQLGHNTPHMIVERIKLKT